MVAPEGPERMLTSRLGKASKRAATAGFTLIELLVVVTIVAARATHGWQRGVCARN